MAKRFPNGFTEWMETHHEIVSFITLILKEEPEIKVDTIIFKRQMEQGTGGIYELAEEWTDEFEKKYKGTAWGKELIYFDEIESFLDNKLKQPA